MMRTSIARSVSETDGTKGAFLQHAQEARLQAVVELADLVEQDVPPSAAANRPSRPPGDAPVKAPPA
jgi:hypothetical protein